MISLIAARARNGAIGKDGTIPWQVPEDLAFFQRETIGGAVIMGRRTWDSLPFKPLKGRLNLVISSRDVAADLVFRTLHDALDEAARRGHLRVYGIGGAGIYRDLLPLAQRLLLSEVDLTVEDADTFFPSFDPVDWAETGQVELRPAQPHCAVHEWVRRMPAPGSVSS